MEVSFRSCVLSGKRTYGCEFHSVFVVCPGTIIESLNGVHHGKCSNIEVEFAEFFDEILLFMPKRLELLFPNLTTLKIYNCGLKKLEHDDLVGLKHLLEIRIVDNQLTSLPDDLFVNMPRLRRINFHSNRL